MFDNHSKLIPALVHKNVDNDFEINIHKFDRTVQVNTFHPTLRQTLVEGILHETQTKLGSDENLHQFTSSVYARPKLKVTKYTSEIEIRHQPQKKVLYKSGVTIFRRFVFEHQPFVEVLGSEPSDEMKNSRETGEKERNLFNHDKAVAAVDSIVYKTTLSFYV